MGLNIYAERFINGEKIGGLPNWDDFGYQGDHELLMCEDFEWKYIANDSYELIRRPVNLELAIQWVKKNVCAENQSRLLDLFELMKLDESIYITFSN